MDNTGFQIDSEVNGECHKSDGVALSSIVLNGDHQSTLKPQTSADRSKLSSGSFNLPKTGALKKYTRFAEGITVNQKQRQYRKNSVQENKCERDLPGVYCIHRQRIPKEVSENMAINMFPLSCMTRRSCAAQDFAGCFPKEEVVWPVVPAKKRVEYGDCSTIPDEVFVHRNVDEKELRDDDVSSSQNEDKTSSMKTKEDFTQSYSDKKFDYFVNEDPRNTGHVLSTVSATIPYCSGASNDQLAHSESIENRRNHRRSYLSAYPSVLDRKATLKKRGLNRGWKLTLVPSGHSRRWLSAFAICVAIALFVVCTSYFAVQFIHKEEAEQLAIAKNATYEKMKLPYDGKMVNGVFTVTNQPVSPALANNTSHAFQQLAAEISNELDVLFSDSPTVSDLLNYTTVTELAGNDTVGITVHCRLSLTAEPMLGEAANLVGIEFLRGLKHRAGKMWLGNFTVDIQSIAFYALTSVPSSGVKFTPRWSPWSAWSTCPTPPREGDTSTRSRLCRLHNGTGEVLSTIDPCLMTDDGGDLEVADCSSEAMKRTVIASAHLDQWNGGMRSYSSITEEARAVMDETVEAETDDVPAVETTTTFTTQLPSSKPRHCAECYVGEVCVALTKDDAPICRQSRDVHDPTGCGGHCRLGVEFCQILDGDAFRCLDDNSCFEEEFQCGDRLCIPASKRCDGHKNCYDATDEMDCECNVTTHFHCLNNTSCLPNVKKCDQVINCWDGSDEANCTAACPLVEQFTCNNGECIQRSYFCDGLADCADRSDEPFGCGGDRCGDNEWKCKNGRCVSKHSLCDKVEDCGDKSDEENCKGIVL